MTARLADPSESVVAGICQNRVATHEQRSAVFAYPPSNGHLCELRFTRVLSRYPPAATELEAVVARWDVLPEHPE